MKKGSTGAARATVPVRWLLLLVVVGPMLLASIIVSVLAWFDVRSALAESTDRLFAETSRTIEDRLEFFLASARSAEIFDAQAFHTGDVDMKDRRGMEAHLLAVLRANPEISSAYVGSPEGGLIDAGREGPGGGEYLIETSVSAAGAVAAGRFVKYAIDASGLKSGILQTVPFFDSRTRPWFKNAVERGGSSWTDIFPLATGQDSAISSSSPVYGTDGQLMAVVSVDLFLSQIREFVRRIDTDEGGTSFIVDGKGLLVVSPTDESVFAHVDSAGGGRRLRAAESADPRVAGAARAFFAATKPGATHVGFRAGRLRLLALAAALPEPAGLGWRIVTVYPESVFFGSLDRTRNDSIVSVSIAVLLLCLFSILLTGYIAAKARDFSSFADAVAEGRWEDSTSLPAFPIMEIEDFRLDLVRMKERLRTTFGDLREEIDRRRRSEAALDASRREKELLLHEVHHRIKNNMHSMMSMLAMQAQASDDERIRTALRDAEDRIGSMMLLYDKLYRSESVSRADAAVYLGDIADLIDSQNRHRPSVVLRRTLCPFTLDASVLMPLGIAANELVSNAYKHAFPEGRGGTVDLGFSVDGGEALLAVQDDGMGMDDPTVEHGFGMSVVEGVAAQLGGRFAVISGQGTRFELRFPVEGRIAGRTAPGAIPSPL